MPITTNDDKLKIFQIIANDPYILSLGFEKSNIERTKTTTEKISSEQKQIFIYPITPEGTLSYIIRRIVYQIDVSAPITDYNVADLCAEQIMALLHNKEITKAHKIILLDPPLVQTSPPSNYCVGIRFGINETVFNVPKKI